MEEFLTERHLDLQGRADRLAQEHIMPNAEAVDRECRWPKHSLEALASEGFMGLHVPRRLGGQEEGLLSLALICETVGKYCPSSAVCFGMHCVGTAVIAAKATRDQEERYLRPIAEGNHVTSLALSEPGNGVHFYLPRTQLEHEDGQFVIDGEKHFVTNGGQADSYVVSTAATGGGGEVGEFTCLVVERDVAGMTWLDPWRGLGMRGNSSRGVRLDGVRVPRTNLLGQEGDQIWYVFEIVAPYFLVAMAATYVGVAQAALDIAQDHLRSREFAHAGTTLGDVPALQSRLAELWMAVAKTRALVYHACRQGDVGDSRALASILACKADAADTVVWVTNEALTICGGIGYRENGRLGQLLREGRASHVMAPSTTVLKEWIGKALLGLPLL